MMNTGTKFSLFAALALFATGPTLAAVTCDPLQRGSLSGGVFTRGTAATDTDYRMACRGEAGDLVTLDDFNGARDAAGADAIVVSADLRFVFDLDGVPIDFHLPQFRLTDEHSGVVTAGLVYLGTVRGDGSGYAAGGPGGPGTLRDDLFVDSWANIHMTGGGRGINIISEDTDTDKVVRARNFGTIVTEGEGPEFSTWRLTGRGVQTWSAGGDAESSNEAGATVTTRGDGADGVRANAGRGATATAINRGTITTTGDALYFQRVVYVSNGLVAITRGGTARAINEAGGEISTGGAFAYGMWAEDRGDAGRAEGTNRGAIATTGAGSDGMGVRSDSGTAAAANVGTIVTRGGVHEEPDGDKLRADGISAWTTSGTVTATNAAGGVIETHGALGRGMSVSALGSGRATAVNAGRIATHSADSLARSELNPDVRSEGADDRVGATGIVALSTLGAAAVTHTGTVTVTGDSAGIYAGAFGTGTTAGVTMPGGRVEASADGVGVWIEVPEGTAEATFSDGAYVTAGTALRVRSCFGGVTVEDSEIRGDLRLSGGCGTHRLTLGDGAIIDGDIVFDTDPGVGGNGDDGNDGNGNGNGNGGDPVCSLPIAELVAIVQTSDTPWDELCIDISSGEHLYIPDVLHDLGVVSESGNGVLSAALAAPAQTGGRVVALHKMGAGTARLQEVTLPGGKIALKDGGLELRGHVDLGAGMVTVHDSARLAFLLGDITANPDDHGRITAGSVTFQQEEAGEPTIVIQVAPEAGDRSEEISAAARENLPQFFPSASAGAQTPTRILKEVGDSEAEPATPTLATLDEDGEERHIGTLEDGITDDSRPLSVAPEIGGDDDEDEAAPSRGGGNDVPEIALGSWALLAFLFGSGLFDDAGAEEAALDECADAPRTGGWCTSLSLANPGAPATVEERARLGGLETWTRLVVADTAVPAAGIAGATAESLSIGMDARLAGGFRLGVAVTPEMTASKPWRPGVASGAALDGERFALRAGWRDGPLFADAELSRGRYESSATLDNPAVGGALSGTFDLVQQQARATAGARIDLGRARLTPALTPFAGTLRQDAWTAASAALTTDVPGVSRRYSGVKTGLGVTSTGWLPGPGGLRWRPSLRFSTVSVDTDGPSSLAMRQSDRAGVLSFASRGVMAGLPRRIHGLAAAATAAGSGTWRLRLGYAGMEVDGEVEHGAGLHLRVRF